MNKKVCYFHELTEDEFHTLAIGQVGFGMGLTYADCEEIFPSPPWCDYPGATEGLMGCWSLVGFMVKDEAYCNKCDCKKD